MSKHSEHALDGRQIAQMRLHLISAKAELETNDRRIGVLDAALRQVTTDLHLALQDNERAYQLLERLEPFVRASAHALLPVLHDVPSPLVQEILDYLEVD